MKTYYGVVTTYDKPFSAQDKGRDHAQHAGHGRGQERRDHLCLPWDAKRNLIVQRKQ